MRIVKRKVLLGLCNRDGEISAVEDVSGICWLVAGADTYHNKEVFSGLGSTEQIQITRVAFDALTEVK